jgi:hypothetical protein
MCSKRESKLNPSSSGLFYDDYSLYMHGFQKLGDTDGAVDT